MQFKHHEDSEKSVSHTLFPSSQFLDVMLTFTLREIYFTVKGNIFNSHFKECSFLKKLKVVFLICFNKLPFKIVVAVTLSFDFYKFLLPGLGGH